MGLVRGDHVDRYRIESLLGAGSYGESYLATDTGTGLPVVLKLANRSLIGSRPLADRFRLEAALARRLDHPNVQSGRDDGHNRSQPYLIVEYVDGTSMQSLLPENHEGLEIAQVVDWGTQLAAGLAYVHSQGFVHRDVKPGNVLVSVDGRLKLADFGSAARMKNKKRRLAWLRPVEIVGTAEYMSPEQAKGGPVDGRSDLYSWGVVMYELLRGEVPFTGDNTDEVLGRHLEDTPKPIRDRRPEVPEDLENVVLHAMRRFPDHRYASADALLVDLARLDGPDPPAAYDRSAEPGMGPMADVDSPRQVLAFAGIVAAGFIGVSFALILTTVLLR
jgi:serine/threonine-protein kinase